jgi:hypothetical protein
MASKRYSDRFSVALDQDHSQKVEAVAKRIRANKSAAVRLLIDYGFDRMCERGL